MKKCAEKQKDTLELCRQDAIEIGVPEQDIERFTKLDFQLHKEGFTLGLGLLGKSYSIGYDGTGADAASGLTLDQVEDWLTLRHRAKELIHDLQLWLNSPGHGAGREIYPVLLEHKLFTKKCCQLIQK